MKLVMTLLVRDEDDVIQSNIEFHLRQGVDFLIVTDNLSDDRTREMLLPYERLGLLRYLYESDDDYSQHEWVTRMARMAATDFGADWVINNDADEFWWPENGTLKETIAIASARANALSAPRRNFLPRNGRDGVFFADAMTIRERQSLNAVGEPLPGKVCHSAVADIEVRQGNHSCARNGVEIAPAPAGITIMHFPIRTYARFANKIIKGGRAYGRNTRLSPETGTTWRRLHAVWQAGGLPDYYERQVLTDRDLADGLRTGELLRDERLRAFLKQSVGGVK